MIGNFTMCNVYNAFSNLEILSKKLIEFVSICAYMKYTEQYVVAKYIKTFISCWYKVKACY